MILIAALGLVGAASAEVAATAAATVPTSNAAEASQTATWTRRRLLHFSPPPIYVPANGYLTNTHFISCDELIDRVKFVLVQLGARADDFVVDSRGCYHGAGTVKSVDVTFSVLAPIDNTGKNSPGAPVTAHWQIVELAGADTGLGDCAFLKYATNKILPLFATREVKLISSADCARFGVGLRAQVLKLSQQQPTSP
jgi:hypothetical protein